jgi:hypothetical protein
VERPDDVAAALVGGGPPPTRLAVEQEDLEAHFLRLTVSGAGRRDAAGDLATTGSLGQGAAS